MRERALQFMDAGAFDGKWGQSPFRGGAAPGAATRRAKWGQSPFSWLVLAAFVFNAGLAWAEDAAAPRPAIGLTMRLQLSRPAALAASDVAPSVFPEGRRCAFTYDGPRNPKVIASLTKAGFRTTAYCGPQTDAAYLRQLEDAGAEIGVTGYWHASGNYNSIIGSNTVQEAFDAITTSRVALQAKCRGVVPCGTIGGHYSVEHFPVSRDVNDDGGYGAVFQDTDFILNTDNKPYIIHAGRSGPRERQILNRENFNNTMRVERVPNEIIYYQILSHQFRGTLRRAESGQIVRFTLRDFKPVDLEDLVEIVGPYGSHPAVWHATEGMIGANERLRAKTRIVSVAPAGERAYDVRLAVDEDIFAPYLLTPLSLALPKDFPLAAASMGGVAAKVTAQDEGVYADVSLAEVFSSHCRMTLKTAAEDMTVPDEQAATLTLANPTDEPLTDATIRWIGSPGLAGSEGMTASGEPAGPFALGPKAEKTVAVKIRTRRGAHFGLTPLAAEVTGKVGGEPRVFLAGFEVPVAPMLRVHQDPKQQIPMRKGRSQYFLVHIANGKDPVDGQPTRLLSHAAGPCKGSIRLDLPAGMRCEPAERPFELGADDAKTLVFCVTNDAWSDQIEPVRPVVLLAGRPEAVEVPTPGTPIVRNPQRIDVAPLDDSGLLVQMTWDDNTRGGCFDRSVGRGQAYYYPGHGPAYNNEGVKGWCTDGGEGRVCQLHSTWKNIDYLQGTVMFYLRWDPAKKNESTYIPDPKATASVGAGRGNQGETIFSAGMVQSTAGSDSGLTLRRFRSWNDKDGYLQLTYQMMGRKLVYCQAPMNLDTTWRHIGLLWSVPQRRLELYIDGKLAARADPGEGPWMPVPWDKGVPNVTPLIVISCDHGLECYTCRDEFYIYDRPLTAEQIAENMAKAKEAPAARP